MNKAFFFAAPLALVACAAEDDIGNNVIDNDMVLVNEATPVANDLAENDSPYLEGRPGQPAIPETVEDPDWTSRYSPDIPYYNRGEQAIPATMGASPRTGLVGMVEPGDGGFIKTCEVDSTYCKISFGGAGKEGYVNMDLMSGEAR